MMGWERAILLCFVLLAACAAPYDYRNIDPRWTIRNSPIPVPKPQAKPTPPTRYAQVATPVKPAPPQRSGDLIVRKGDTVYGIARANGVEVRDLIAANGLRPPYILHPGERLRLPGGRFHVVAKGETGYGISRRYGVDVATLMRINDVPPPYRLSVGQRLRLPVQSQTAPVQNPGPVKVAVTPPPPIKTTGPVDVRPATQVSKVGFQWPLEGRIISRYGPKENGLHNDGINIGAKRGAHVRAARDGVVAYAGNGFKGFGNILLIRHDGGWISAYAHNERLLVAKGQSVKRGQVIARVGTSGSATTPQLHFEIRKGRAALDPESQLPKLRS